VPHSAHASRLGATQKVSSAKFGKQRPTETRRK
jgi:hypothetical protein